MPPSSSQCVCRVPQATFRRRGYASLLVLCAVLGAGHIGAQQSNSSVPTLAPIRWIGAPGQLKRPIDLVALEAHTVVLENDTESPLVLFSSSDGRLLRRFGTRGGSSDAFLNPIALERDVKRPNSIWVHDIGRSQIIRVAWASAAGEVTVVRRQLPTTLPITSWAIEHSGELIVTGLLPNRRVARLDSLGQVVSLMAEIPGARSEPASVRQEAYRSTIASKPDGRRFVLASRHTDRLEVFDSEGHIVSAAPRVASFEPSYRVAVGRVGPIMSTDNSLRFGYIDVGSSSKRIFALYSGKSRKDGKGQASLGEEIHVLDWNGKLIGRYRLPRAALAISVHNSGDEVHALHMYPSPVIAVYKLPRRPQ